MLQKGTNWEYSFDCEVGTVLVNFVNWSNGPSGGMWVEKNKEQIMKQDFSRAIQLETSRLLNLLPKLFDDKVN